MRPQALIIDTNVVIAGLLSSRKNSPVARILDAMLVGRLLFLLSPSLLAEYRTVLLRPKLTKLHGLDTDEIDELLATLTANAAWREPAVPRMAPDPGDDHLWALLMSQPRGILVTGDRLLLDKPPEHHRVLSPKDCAGQFLR